ncbi:MAG: hypothetical protein AABX29_07165 [Nanoarchaeota archaeon]
MKNKAILIILAVFLISSVSAVQVCEVYDDFSSGVLNASKWSESTATTFFTDEHFVDTSNENYHVAQYSAVNRDTKLIFNRDFFPGEEFKYTLTYNSGSGNQYSSVFPWGDDASAIIEDCTTPSPGCGGVGYWNGETAIGIQKGNYLVAYQFFDNYVILNFTRPDNTNIWFKMSNLNPPYHFGVSTSTGHNGVMHFDYDNFELCTEQEEPSCQDRINELETQVSELTNKINLLKSLVEKLQSYMWFLKTSAKKDILCSNLKETGGKEMVNFGMWCEIKELKKGDVCVCKKV